MHRTFQAIISGTKNTATTGNSMQLLQLPAPLGNSKKKSSKKEQQRYPDSDRTKERY
jgi:hemolysin-activating ACP:hemolysin acyltransferase